MFKKRFVAIATAAALALGLSMAVAGATTGHPPLKAGIECQAGQHASKVSFYGHNGTSHRVSFTLLTTIGDVISRHVLAVPAGKTLHSAVLPYDGRFRITFRITAPGMNHSPHGHFAVPCSAFKFGN